MPTRNADAPMDTALPPTAVVGAAGDNDRPDFPHPSYNRMKLRWKKCRDLMIGTEAIREGGEAYLPMLEQESQKSYDARRTIAAVYDGFKRTVKAAVGMLFQKEPVLGKDMAPELVELAENIDNEGNAFRVWARNFVEDAIVDGHAGLLTEYPRVDNAEKLDAAQVAALKLRPYWVKVMAEDIYRARYARVNGVTMLMLLVIREVTEESVGLFGSRNVTRYRVYRQVAETVQVELWEPPAADSAGKPVQKGTAVVMRNATRIPFRPLITGQKVGPLETIPPLVGLADLNIEHHRIKTGRESLEELAFVPTLKRKGYKAPVGADGKPNPAPVLLGPRHVVDVPIEGDVAWFSPDVAVLEPSAATLADIKADMGNVGLSFLAPDTRAAETATAKEIDSEAQNATIATIAGDAEDCFEGGFQDMAMLLTNNFQTVRAGSVTVNREFVKLMMDSGMVTALGNLASQGKLDLDTLLERLEDGGVLPKGFDRVGAIRRIHQQDALPPETKPTEE